MRAIARLMAAPSSIGAQSAGLRAAPPALLPPIPLYRRILRGHRKHLPTDMRVLGDQYIKSEFRAHRNIDNPVHIVRLAWIHFQLVPITETRDIDRLLVRMADVRTTDRG